MKKIDLYYIQLPNRKSHYTVQRKYQIWLGNNCKAVFGSIAEAKHFLAQTNLFLTQTLYELNEIYISTYSIYRRNWFYFPKNTDNIVSILEIIEKFFMLAVNKGYSPNSNYFVFNHLFSIIKNLSELLLQTQKIVQMNSHCSILNQINVYQLELKRVYERIESWGKDGFKIQIVDDEFSKSLAKQPSFDFFNKDQIQSNNE